jgi:hypothetical protein
MSDALPIELDPKRLTKRINWEIDRARNERRKPASDTSMVDDFAPIIFPDTAGLRHAALVVAGHMADRPDAVAATRTILEALAIPQIMRDGGDGRVLRIQNGPVRFGEQPEPTFDVEIEDERPYRGRKK